MMRLDRYHIPPLMKKSLTMGFRLMLVGLPRLGRKLNLVLVMSDEGGVFYTRELAGL